MTLSICFCKAHHHSCWTGADLRRSMLALKARKHHLQHAIVTNDTRWQHDPKRQSGRAMGHMAPCKLPSTCNNGKGSMQRTEELLKLLCSLERRPWLVCSECNSWVPCFSFQHWRICSGCLVIIHVGTCSRFITASGWLEQMWMCAPGSPLQTPCRMPHRHG